MRGLSAGFAGNQSSATIAKFPNVALYLDDQSMQFPARNVDIYMVDMERVEVLEGPQGTLFGGGAEAGAIRYITNKPKLEQLRKATPRRATAPRPMASHNASANAILNVPLIQDKLAVRAVIYRRPSRRLHRQRAQHLHPLEQRPGQLLLQASRRTAPACAPTACRRRRGNLRPCRTARSGQQLRLARPRLQPGRLPRHARRRRSIRSTTTGTC